MGSLGFLQDLGDNVVALLGTTLDFVGKIATDLLETVQQAVAGSSKLVP